MREGFHFGGKKNKQSVAQTRVATGCLAITRTPDRKRVKLSHCGLDVVGVAECPNDHTWWPSFPGLGLSTLFSEGQSQPATRRHRSDTLHDTHAWEGKKKKKAPKRKGQCVRSAKLFILLSTFPAELTSVQTSFLFIHQKSSRICFAPLVSRVQPWGRRSDVVERGRTLAELPPPGEKPIREDEASLLYSISSILSCPASFERKFGIWSGTEAQPGNRLDCGRKSLGKHGTHERRSLFFAKSTVFSMFVQGKDQDVSVFWGFFFMQRRWDDGEEFYPGAALSDVWHIRVNASEESCCQGANTSPVRLLTWLLRATNGLFQEACVTFKTAGRRKNKSHSNERLSDCMPRSEVLEQWRKLFVKDSTHSLPSYTQNVKSSSVTHP